MVLHHQSLRVSALELFQLQPNAAEEFLEVYKTVLPEANAMIKDLASGACLVAEVCGDGDGDGDIVQELRRLCGPYDPEIARHLRPDTLRARFGSSKVKNAVHCTDLDADGVLEVC